MDLSRECLCPKCGEPMEVLLPIWVCPGSESIDTGAIQYDSAMKYDSNNWFCNECGTHHLPIDNGHPPTPAIRGLLEACRELIDTIDATGGLEGEGVAVDPDWVDLASAYHSAVRAIRNAHAELEGVNQ